MKKGFWIAFSVFLLIINIFFGFKLRSLNKHPFSGKISISEENGRISLPSKESLLTLIVYFSYRSCEECMKESLWWNELYKDLPREDINIVGLVPGNEEIENISDKYSILFPVYYDKNLFIVRRFLISITPFKIILDRKGKLLYMAPTYKDESSQEDFYFVVVELLRKAKQAEAQDHWKKG